MEEFEYNRGGFILRLNCIGICVESIEDHWLPNGIPRTDEGLRFQGPLKCEIYADEIYTLSNGDL